MHGHPNWKYISPAVWQISLQFRYQTWAFWPARARRKCQQVIQHRMATGNSDTATKTGNSYTSMLQNVGIISHTAGSAWFKILQCHFYHSVFLICQSGVIDLQHRALGGSFATPQIWFSKLRWGGQLYVLGVKPPNPLTNPALGPSPKGGRSRLGPL